MTTPSTLSSTSGACSMRNSPEAFSPVSTSIGIVSFVFAKRREVRGVLLEGAEQLEAGAHAAGRGIGGGVELAIRFRDRVRRVGGEVVPEVLEVDALAAGDQLQRRLAVEVEVPEVAQQPDALPVADAGQERVHQHDPLDLGRILRGVGVGDHQADVVADDAARARGRATAPARGCPAPSSSCRSRRPASATGRCRAGRARSRLVLAQLGHQRPPHVAGLGVAVQEDHRVALRRPSGSASGRR